MTTIVTRASKGSALTWTEGDANITNLNNDKIELTDLSVSTGSASGGGTLSYNNTTGAFSFAPADLSSYLTSYTETDPVVGAVTGIVKADGAGNISAATAGTDYLADITSESIGDLSNVDLTGIADGQVLVWDNANSKFIAGDAGSVSAINDLSDVTITTPSNGQVLTYMASGQWENQDLPSGASQLSQLSDVNATGLSGGEILIYNNGTTQWDATVQSFVSTLNDLTDVDTSGATVGGEVLTYNSGTSTWEAQTLTSGLTDIVQDMSPQLGGSLDVNNYSITSTSSGDINIIPDGTGIVNMNNIVYREKVYSIGSSDTPTIDPGNAPVQTLTITSGLSLPAFEGETAGQSVTLLVTGSGTATGATGYKFAGGETTLTSYSVVSIFYDGTTYWCSINTDFQ